MVLGLAQAELAQAELAELVLNLNCFDFDGNYYQQVGGVAMGTKMGPNYACLFVGYVENKMFEEYQGRKPELYKVTSMTSLAPPLILDKISRTSYIFVQPIILLLSILLR